MKTSLHRFAFLVTLAMALAGCGQSTTSSVGPAERLAPISETGTDSASPEISEEQAATFAAAWEKAIADGDVVAGADLIWFDKMLDRVIASFDMDPKFVAGFKKGANSRSPIANMVRHLKTNDDAGGTYRLVRVVNRDGFRHAVFRLLGPNGALNYHDLRIVRDGDHLRADKLFVAMTGEKISDSMKTLMAPLVAKLTPMSRLTGGQNQAMKMAKQQSAVSNAIMAGDMALALETYGKLPDNVKKMKMMQVYRLTALAQFTDREKEYLDAMDQYAEIFPGDPSLALISIDAAVLRDDMDLLVKAHRDLTTWSAGDPFLDLMIGAVLGSSGQAKEGQSMVTDVDVSSLNLPMAHDYRMSIAMANDDHAETLKQLIHLRDDFGYEFGDLAAAEDFQAFVKSPEYQSWTK